MKRERRVVGLLIAALTTAGLAVPAGAAPRTAKPDPGRIAFSYGDQFPGGDDITAHTDIYSVAPDGTDLRQLTHVPAAATAAIPAWSGDGTSIAYESDVSGKFEIWAMDADGKHKHQVTNDPDQQNLEPSWSPDGKQLVFSRCDTPFGFLAKCDLEVVNANGTGMHRVLGDNRYYTHASFSPDGKSLVFSSDRAGYTAAIWTVKTDGSHLHQVTAPGTEGFWPSWDADGQHVVYSNHCCLPHSNVYRVKADGSDARLLTHAPGGHNDAFGSLSPDGRGLVYDSDEAYADACCNDLVVRHGDGTTTTLVSGSAGVVAASWGPASSAAAVGGTAQVALPKGTGRAASAAATVDRIIGRRTSLRASMGASSSGASRLSAAVAGTSKSAQGRIAWADFTTGEIYGVGPAGGDQHQITHTPDGWHASSPDWSPDGATLVYTQRTDDGLAAQIWTVHADGSHARRLVKDTAGFRDDTPRYSPDGHTIVFSRCQPDDGVCAIWAVDADGKHRRAVTKYHTGENEAVDFGASIASDGQVAFTRFGWRGIAAQVFLIGLDGSHEHAVTPPSLEASAAEFSPDGSRLVLTSQSPRLGSNVWSLRRDGHDLRHLTASKYPNNDFDGSFSPSGTKIAFASDRAYDDFCCADLFTMNADGSGEHIVSTDVHGVSQVSWGKTAE
jgi:Tol biopolymer transport system component